MGWSHGIDDSSSSSGEEDGNAEWKAAISSIANGLTSTDSSSHSTKTNGGGGEDDGEKNHHKSKSLKLYQIKAQKILDDLIEKSLVLVTEPVPEVDIEPTIQEGGMRLFGRAPPGIASDPTDEFQHPRKRPKILPGEVVDEKSKKFRRQLQSAVVDGMDILAAARDSHKKSLDRLEAKDAAAKAAAKREEERVANLKKIRGEKWLPSIAKEMLAKDAAAKAAAKREEERVANLKKIRGEKWLPSIAKEMLGRK